MGVVIQLTRNDNAVPVDFFLVDQSNNAVDLSNTSCKFKMALPSSFIDAVNSNMTLQSAAGGIARYQFVQVDLANDGTYEAEIEATYAAGNASGRVLTARGITVIVGAQEPQ